MAVVSDTTSAPFIDNSALSRARDRGVSTGDINKIIDRKRAAVSTVGRESLSAGRFRPCAPLTSASSVKACYRSYSLYPS